MSKIHSYRGSKWEFIVPTDTQYFKDNKAHLNTWLAPKDVSIAATFIAEHTLLAKQIAIYGAGSHTTALLMRLPQEVRNKVCCILDIFPQGKAFPVPVIHPAALDNKYSNVDLVVLSHFDFEDSMFQTLRAHGIQENRIFPVYTHSKYPEFALSRLAIPEIRIPESKGRRVIAFISLRATRKIITKDVLHALQERDQFLFLNLDMGREIESDNDQYDLSVDCKRSILFMTDVIDRIQPDLVYVHDQIETHYLFVPLLKACFPQLAVVWEPYDILRLMLDDYSILIEDKGLNPSDIAFIQSNEEIALQSADGVVYKETGVLAQSLMEEKRAGAALPFGQYLGKAQITSASVKYTLPYRLVYSGSLDASGKHNVFTGDNYLVEQFEDFLRQGLMLDLYLNCNKEELQSLYKDYLPLEQAFPSFQMFPHRRVDDLIPEISHAYHFGLQIGRCNAEILRVNRRRYQSTFCSKVLTYCYAGLPVIVNTELESMAQLVTRYQLGLVISCHDYSQLGEKLNEMTPAEYQCMKENVKAFAKANTAETRALEMSQYLRSILATHRV